MANNWIQTPTTSNLLKQTYVKDFLDISGSLYFRNGNMNIMGDISANGDLTCKNLSVATGALDSGVNVDVQNAIDLKQDTLIPGTNISITGNEVSVSGGGGGVTGLSNNVSGDVIITIDTVVSGDLEVTDNIYVDGVEVHTSDDRLKINEIKIETALTEINKLRPEIYNKKISISDDTGIYTKESGLIAQDIWYNTPSLRHLVQTNQSWKIQDMSMNADIQNDPDYEAKGWSTEPALVNYTGIIPYLVKSIQELNAKYEENQTLIENYKTSNNV